MKLVVKDLAFGYQNKAPLWMNVNFTINPGDIFAIMGANGCGKSTLIRCIIGFLKPQSGSVQIIEDDGMVYASETDTAEFTKRIGYVPQMQDTAYAFTVRDFIVMGRAPHLGLMQKPSKNDFQMVDDIMEEMGIAQLADHAFNTLSGGQQRQAVIARAIIQEPELIIMDEPVNHLDFGNQFRVIEMIEKLAQRGIAVIFTTHAPDHALYFKQNVGAMLDGQLQVGPADDIITEDLLSKLYNLHVRILRVPNSERKMCLAERSV